MRIYQRIGPNTGIGVSLGGLIFFGFLLLLGILPFLSAALFIVVTCIVFALMLIPILALWGIIYRGITGRDARVPMPGARGARWGIETWMEGKGWIRLPKRP